MSNEINENIDSKIDEAVEDTTPEVEETEENNEEEAIEVDSDNEDKLSILEKKVKELEAQKNHWKQKAIFDLE
jgi:FtsZ-binding cell division protein ZapB